MLWYNLHCKIINLIINMKGRCNMKGVKTISKGFDKMSGKSIGCGECQTSCQSACKTSCTIANQKCENDVFKDKKD